MSPKKLVLPVVYALVWNVIVCCKKGLMNINQKKCATGGVKIIGGLPNNSGKLVGGRTDFDPRESRYRSSVGLAIISKTSKGETLESCSGALVASNLILTAGHCLKSKSITSVKVIFGKDFENASKIQATEYLQSPKFISSNEQHDDIAWVKIPENSLPEGFKPTAVLNKSMEFPLGKKITLVGYGKSSSDDNKLPTKRYAETYVERIPDSKVFPNEVWMKPFSFTNVGSCSGDSGGAAYIENGQTWTLFAVVMGRRFDQDEPQTCEAGKSVVTLIAPYKNWIEESSKIKFIDGAASLDQDKAEFKFGSPENFTSKDCT